MTSAADMLAAVEENWTDRTLALVAADLVEEEDGKGRFAALRRVAQARRVFTDAAELARAAYCLSPDGPHREELYLSILWEVKGTIAGDCTVYLVPGRSRPRRREDTPHARKRRDRRLTITVGARWVLWEEDTIADQEALDRDIEYGADVSS